MVKVSWSDDKAKNEQKKTLQGFELYKSVKSNVRSCSCYTYFASELTLINNVYLIEVTMKNGDVYFGQYNDVMKLLAQKVNQTVLDRLGIAKRPF
jgi:hypothetical protein